MRKDWSLLRALRLSVPPVWDSRGRRTGARRRSTCSPTAGGRSAACAAWDGPAGVVATDGRVLAGLVDRMGLRPVRWCADDRGWLYIGSRVRRLRPRHRPRSSPAASSSRGR